MEAEVALEKLAAAFAPTPLYAVGGCVRDALLGYACADVDICSELSADKVRAVLEGLPFTVSDKSMRMGTLHISTHGFSAEYTAFRTDSYDRESGVHYPLEVRFTNDLRLDALRRDFKCNAVYYDLQNKRIVDPLGGVEDIRNGIVSAADSPEQVFEADGLRVLRLIRFAATLGFEIQEDTYLAAKRNAYRVKDITAERIRDELDRIFTADVVHDMRGAHLRGLRLLDEFGLIDLLLPELAALKGLAQPPKYHLYDAYEHSVKAFEASPPDIRWAALLHDIGKAPAVKAQGNMHGHDVIGAEMARNILNRLRFSNARKDEIIALIKYHMTDLNGDMSEAKLRRFAVEHYEYISALADLKDADAFASCGKPLEKNRIRSAAEEIKRLNLPTCVKELCVDGRDLMEIGVPEKIRSTALKALLLDTALDPALNDRERALKYLKKTVGRK